MSDLDQRLRIAAFDWFDPRRPLHGEVLRRELSIEGFTFEVGARRSISPQQGTHNPAVLDQPLSIRPHRPSERKPRPLNDALSPDGLLPYRSGFRQPSGLRSNSV